MHTRRLGALLVALALLAAACGGAREDASSEGGAASEGGGGSEATCGEPSTGVSDDAVTLGGIYPLSGPASAYGAVPAGLQAYIEYTNEEQGGAPGAFEGRTIEYVLEDDSYSPPNSVEAARKLVERDQVFAILQSRAPRPSAAIWDYLNEQEVPQVVATGATMFGLDVAGHPWTIGWQPDYVSEARGSTRSTCRTTSPRPRLRCCTRTTTTGWTTSTASRRPSRAATRTCSATWRSSSSTPPTPIRRTRTTSTAGRSATGCTR